MLISRALDIARDYFRRDAEYIEYNKGLIAGRNSDLLRLGCIIYLCVLAVYGTFVYFSSPSKLLFFMYVVFFVFHIILTFLVIIRPKHTYGSYRVTQKLCIILEISILLFFGVEGVFPYPETHSLYVPIAIFLVMTLFTHPSKYVYTLIVCYCSLFAALAYFVKDISVSLNDMRIAAATLVSALICYTLISLSRHNEGFARKRLEYMSSIDTLTGIYNKQTLESICGALLKEERRHDYAIIILDMDNFKHINDTYGHLMGDRVLSQVGKALSSVFSKYDYVGRFGGDEFVIMMRIEKRGAYAVYTKLNTICEKIAETYVDGLGEKLACSIGASISYYDEANNNDFEDMLRRADAALYEAKNAGRNQYRVT